jgi:uncharacterized membrane protein YfcA
LYNQGSIPLAVTLFLFLAAFVGGALNAVAGGGSFIGLPALIFAGVPAVSANATNTLALWPASISSAWAYRREVATTRSWIVRLGGASLAGGLVGGQLLLRTSDDSFLRLLPWLLLIAAATFSFGGPIQRVLTRQHSGGAATRHPAGAAEHPGGAAAQHSAGAAEHPGGAATRHSGPVSPVPFAVLFLQFVISIYGGYFGGGMGIMMLATLTIAGMTDIHQMNAVKSALAVIINGVALAEFIALGAIAWAPGAVMVAGGIAGGYAGAATARRVDQRSVRGLVTIIAWGMTLYFFLR